MKWRMGDTARAGRGMNCPRNCGLNRNVFRESRRPRKFRSVKLGAGPAGTAQSGKEETGSRGIGRSSRAATQGSLGEARWEGSV